MRKLGLTVTATAIPNLDRILQARETDIRSLVMTDLAVLFDKVHNKYGSTIDLPKAEQGGLIALELPFTHQR